MPTTGTQDKLNRFQDIAALIFFANMTTIASGYKVKLLICWEI
jgi:hypothetical protein